MTALRELNIPTLNFAKNAKFRIGPPAAALAPCSPQSDIADNPWLYRYGTVRKSLDRRLPNVRAKNVHMETESISTHRPSRDELYQEAAAAHGAALERLARGYEADPDRRRDLLQEIHLALWQSFAGFDGRCSVRTWVYRVAHNVATSHVIRDHRLYSRLVGLDILETLPTSDDRESDVDHRNALEKLLKLIHQLKPLDRQVILSYLEGLDAASIAEVVGISPGNVATKIHRIKDILARRFREGGNHGK
jgi:RNA polymerase sigma-70 factor (ECF subfamily)